MLRHPLFREHSTNLRLLTGYPEQRLPSAGARAMVANRRPLGTLGGKGTGGARRRRLALAEVAAAERCETERLGLTLARARRAWLAEINRVAASLPIPPLGEEPHGGRPSREQYWTLVEAFRVEAERCGAERRRWEVLLAELELEGEEPEEPPLAPAAAVALDRMAAEAPRAAAPEDEFMAELLENGEAFRIAEAPKAPKKPKAPKEPTLAALKRASVEAWKRAAKAAGTPEYAALAENARAAQSAADLEWNRQLAKAAGAVAPRARATAKKTPTGAPKAALSTGRCWPTVGFQRARPGSTVRRWRRPPLGRRPRSLVHRYRRYLWAELVVQRREDDLLAEYWLRLEEERRGRLAARTGDGGCGGGGRTR